MKKYPEFTEEQNNEWGNLFASLVNESFEYHIFSNLYHKGYCIFSKSENIYKEIAEKLDEFIPSVPYELNDMDRSRIEIDIKC